MLFDHCAKVYKAMLDASHVEEIDGEAVRVYEGHLTKLVNGLDLAAPYYTSTKNALADMGCIAQLRRGGGTAQSRWILVKEPSEDLFNETPELNKPGTGKMAVMEQQLRDLKKRMDRVEQAVGL
jgi:hypothetical protein